MIYSDTNICQWHLRQIIPTPNSNSAIFHVPFPYNGTVKSEFEARIDQALLDHDRVAVLISELHASTVDFCLRYQNPKIRYFICGFINGVDSHPWMDWFVTSTGFYKNNSILDRLTPYVPKPKTFDILLGLGKMHRNFVYDFITREKLNDQVVMSYLGNPNITVGIDSDRWIWEDEGLEIDTDEITWTVTPVKYYGHNISLSQIVPIKIYNQTAYSVVAETNFDNHYNFYTEKIVKPILAERLFIVFGSYHYLQNLRKLGFKTFDGIIDESYDSVEDQRLRFKLATDQMLWLFDQPQEEILEKIRPITEHNKKVMIETDWYGEFSRLFSMFLHGQQEQN